MPEEVYLPCGAVAALFHVSVRTVNRWCQAGAFAGAVRTWRRNWRIPATSVESVLVRLRSR